MIVFSDKIWAGMLLHRHFHLNNSKIPQTGRSLVGKHPKTCLAFNLGIMIWWGFEIVFIQNNDLKCNIHHKISNLGLDVIYFFDMKLF